MTALPIDGAERVAVRDEHGVSVFVEAGAGTGKTTAIVARVVAMVATGWFELRELAAITFTEAAASELRDRIREGLEAASDGRNPQVCERDEQERCREALHQLDEAALTTLHGFAQRILADHPLEAGLPPGFEVLDPIQARVELEQRWAAFVDEIFADPALEATLLRGLALGLGPEDLHGVALELDDHHDRLVAAPPADLTLNPLTTDPVVAALDVLLDHRSNNCRNDDDNLARHIDGLRTWRDLLERARDEFDIIDLLLGAPRLQCKQGQKGSWDDVSIVRDATVALAELVQATLLAQRLTVLEMLSTRVSQFVIQAADARRVAGTLEFHDLLVFARDLLRRDPDVRAAVSARYRCVLLDEFQDTDPLQIELAVFLTTDDPDAGSKHWSDVAIRPGALVVVGDPKQSIYRFRRADLRVYHRAREGLALQTHTLVENFRSVPGVIDYVNHVFADLLEEDPGVQAAHVELHAHRGPVGHDVPVGVFGTAADGRVADIRALEADDVAAIVRQVKDERWEIEDPITHEVRDAQYKDIALLIPSRTVLPALEDALERADVPVRVESQSLVFSTAEVRDLLAVLSAVDDPTDEIAVVAALRSPGFACSDAELMEFVRLGGHWDYRRDPPEDLAADHPVIAGLFALRSYWEQRWWRTVSETTEAIVRERHLLELALERRRPRDHWRRVRYLLDQARAWDDAGDASLRAFVEWVQQQADERARVMESVTPEPDDDAIRILTVHGSKGLEFPIVLLAGLNTLPVHSARGVIWGDNGPEFGVGTKKVRAQTPGYDAAAAEEDRHEAAERLRLLYVAMTRARDHLVVSLHHKTDSNCHAARVAARLDGASVTHLEPDPPKPQPSQEVGNPPDSANPDVRAQWLADRSIAVARAAQPASVSATALAHMDDPEKGETEKQAVESDPSTPWRKGRAGTAVGRAVHAVLQTIDLASGAGVAETARAQALAEQVPDHEAEIRSLAESVLTAPTIRSATAAGARCWREVPVGARIDGVLVEGFIDLLIEDGDGFTVVDYKTDQVPSDDDVAAAVARYTPQGAAYALALEAVLDRPIRRCVFVFARATGVMEQEVGDLPGAVARVRERLALVHTVGAQPQPSG